MGKRGRDALEADDEEVLLDPIASAEALTLPRGSFRFDSASDADKDRYFAKLYQYAPDFKELARVDPAFHEVISNGDSSIDFNDAKAVMQLTKTLLKVDFALDIELPDDRLCPPVPNRHAYILWLKGLLDTSSRHEKPERNVLGLDIGTGASCIYPLLGCRQRPWSFIATDVDEKSLQHARKNVVNNRLEDRITLLKTEPTGSMIPPLLSNQVIDFTMTNPPFYASQDEMHDSAKQKGRPPNAVCTGSSTEMIIPGGEVGFVKHIIEESLHLRERIRWYTAMLGFLSSTILLLEELRNKHGIDNYAVSELVMPGNKTRRWVIAWSFRAARPSQSVARGLSSSTGIPKRLLPPVTEANVMSFPLADEKHDAISIFADHLSAAISSLDLLSWTWEKSKLQGIGEASANVWGRSWRRRQSRMRGEVLGTESQVPEDNRNANLASSGSQTCIFAFMVCVVVKRTEAVVRCLWLEGYDSTIFESFQGFLKTAALAARS